MVRGDVYWVRFKEPDKTRPALVITRNSAIPLLNSVTVIPITSSIRDNPSTVALDEADGMPKSCIVTVDNIQTVSKGKVAGYITHLEPAKIGEVLEAIRFAFAFDEE